MGLEYLENLVKQTWDAGKPIEASADKAELDYLSSVANAPSIKTIGEIGFNAGLSSFSFLKSNANARVYSFDINEYDYVEDAKKHIDKMFPGRHELIIGDSRQTVPKFHKENPHVHFDLIFIDGGHDYETVKADIINMKKLANEGTKIIIDDLTPWKEWGIGPPRAWQEARDQGIIVQEELFKDGQPIKSITPPGDRIWALGHYAI